MTSLQLADVSRYHYAYSRSHALASLPPLSIPAKNDLDVRKKFLKIALRISAPKAKQCEMIPHRRL